MAETELRNLVVETAKAWHGRRESNGTHKVIIDVYNAHSPLARGYRVTYSDWWCATFVSAVACLCKITDIMPTECSCYYMIELFKKLGRWHEGDDYTPQPGDIVMYDWQDDGKGDNTGVPDHVGIVYSVSGNSMQIIEGNLDNAVGYRTLQVNGKYIRGYCLPDYASKAKTMSKPAGGDTTVKTCTPTLPQLSNGDKGQAVKALQSLLVLRGYKLPNYGVDGDFGTETQTVLELFQKKQGLTVDGIAGVQTWKALVG